MTEEPLLQENSREFVGTLAEDGDCSCSLTILDLGDVEITYVSPSRYVPFFGYCGPPRRRVEKIQCEDLIACRLDEESSCRGRIQLVYMPVVKPDAKKPVRSLRTTPWLDLANAHSSLKTYFDQATQAYSKKKILIIMNPKSGTGNAEALIEKYALPVLQAAQARIDKIVTKAPRHATEIAKDVTVGKYDVIMSAGGDGTFHEIVQGLLDRVDWEDCVSKVHLVQIPCGSGNALAASTGIWDVSSAAYTAIKGRVSRMDVASIIQPKTRRRLYSFLSVTYGLVANLDIGTEHLRWMGGNRFIWGAIQEIFSQKTYPVTISLLKETAAGRVPAQGHKAPPLDVLSSLLDSEGNVKGVDTDDRKSKSIVWDEEIDGTVQLFTLSNMPWLDMNFNLHPHAKLDQGTFNFLYSLGKQGISKSFRLLTEAEHGNHMHLIEERDVRAFRINPVAENTWLVIDGEVIDRSVIYGEVHRNLLSILT
ncbi:hypothetical protein M9435_006127 [Picochlorum sp. BPE23]|nr:hypothetical protein M9435_006127 [Picochlorum sp. BPE23]